MAYLKAYIPACEGYGWQGGPEFKTRIVEMSNGRERRNADWAQPRHRFTLPFLNIDPSEYSGIKQHHYVCRGMNHAFLYRDPLDYTAINELFDTGDGIRQEFQLAKLSVVDNVSYLRNVYALYSPAGDGDAMQATPVVTVNGVPTAVTVDYERGIVMFSSAPANGALLRWSGEFSIWVRFNQDWLPFSIGSQTKDGYASSGTIDLIELPPPDEVAS